MVVKIRRKCVELRQNCADFDEQKVLVEYQVYIVGETYVSKQSNQ